MASVSLPDYHRGAVRASIKKRAVPVKFTPSGTPYVTSAVSAISPETVKELVRERLTKQDGTSG